jgi:hypothetical protein
MRAPCRAEKYLKVGEQCGAHPSSDESVMRRASHAAVKTARVSREMTFSKIEVAVGVTVRGTRLAEPGVVANSQNQRA